MLQSLGAKSVPVVSRGDQFVFGQSIGDVAAFVGIDFDPKPQLSPDQLVEQIHMVLSAAQRYIGQFPEAVADRDVLDRRRTHRELAYHVFRVVEALLECAGGRELSHQFYADNPPAGMSRFSNIVEYGGQVQARFSAWWDSYEDRSCAKNLNTYFGRKPLHQVMERTAWHAGQHVRQFMMLLENLMIEPDTPLTATDFAGLPMPEKVWDDE